MNIDTDKRMYKIEQDVYIGTCRVQVHNQRGKLYVNYKGRQVNIKDIPILPSNEPEYDCVFDYIFNGGFKTHPCPAMSYWIYRHRMGNKVSTVVYKQKFDVRRKYFNQKTVIYNE